MSTPSVLVAIPGTLASPSLFRPLADRLAGAVTVDPVSWLTEPGPWTIEAVADRIAARIRDQWSGPVLVAGHSTGGAIALSLALAHPDLVAGLLIVNSGAHMRAHGDADRILDLITNNWGPDLHGALLDRSFATELTAEDRAELLAYAATVPQEAALAAVRSQRALDLTDRLAEITCPTTIVHGLLDTARTPAHARELADLIPDSELVLVNTGHSPIFEDPDAVAEQVRALAARTS